MNEYKIRNAHCAYYEGQTGLCRAKEFVKCNPVNCKLYTIDELSTIVDLQDKLQAKEKECEELKQWKKDAENLFKTQTDNADKIINRYKRTLDKIKKIASKHYISIDDYNKIRNNKWVYAFSKGYATARWELINLIQNIINKAKEK